MCIVVCVYVCNGWRVRYSLAFECDIVRKRKRAKVLEFQNNSECVPVLEPWIHFDDEMETEH